MWQIFRAFLAMNHRRWGASQGCQLVVLFSSNKTVLVVLLSRSSRVRSVSCFFQLDSLAVKATPPDACTPVRRIRSNSGVGDKVDVVKLVAVVDRGGCKFVTKARHAQRAGFAGLVILDTQSHTGFRRIVGGDDGGKRVALPTVFLLKPEADRLREMLREEGGAIRVFVQGGSGHPGCHLALFFFQNKNVEK